MFIWRNYKTTISNVIQSFLIYFIAKGSIWPDEAILVSGVLTAIGITANVAMKKR